MKKRTLYGTLLLMILMMTVCFRVYCQSGTDAASESGLQEPSGAGISQEFDKQDINREEEGTAMSFQKYVLEEPVMPLIPPYPDESLTGDFSGSGGQNQERDPFDVWWEAREEKNNAESPDLEELYQFSMSSAKSFFSYTEQDNPVYSPVNLWFCLNLLSELTNGESREQILSALGSEKPEEQTNMAASMWKLLYWDDGRTACVPNAAVWLDETVEIKEDIIKTLGEKHFATVLRGKMGDASYDTALQEWLNKQTRGLLSDAVSDLHFEPDELFSVCTTLYMKGEWGIPFDEAATAPDVFHGTKGDTQVDFMHSSTDGVVFSGENFSAVIQVLRDAGNVFLVLPKEGVSPEALLDDEEFTEFLRKSYEWENVSYGMVKISLPRLDLSAMISLRQGLEAMGIADIFDPEAADFHPALSSDKPLFLYSLEQYARLIMDEKGVEAAAFTISQWLGAMVPKSQEVDFKLDRPFLFFITDERSIPLFMGIVNTF